MSAAHGGQVIASQTVVDALGERVPGGVALRDLGSVRLRDLARRERLYQVTHAELRADFPALRSLEATPNNLPQQITPFVGRERELAEVRAMLAGTTRMLTLIGIGGLGKTRLSLQVGAEVLDDFPDGVWFVELAPCRMRARSGNRRRVLGVKEGPGRPVSQALLDFMKDRHLLLILDNCEHLAQPCAALARDILRAGPQVKILASSRQAARISRRGHIPVVDAHGSGGGSEGAAVGADAKRSRRALLRAVHWLHSTRFAMTEQNAPAVVEICRRLDGIPLAIELAAARVRALSPAQIATRLSDRFRLLTKGDSTALPRQQTLRACLDWSFDLLSEPERILFRRLCVFADGWTLEAAEAVCWGARSTRRTCSSS